MQPQPGKYLHVLHSHLSYKVYSGTFGTLRSPEYNNPVGAIATTAAARPTTLQPTAQRPIAVQQAAAAAQSTAVQSATTGNTTGGNNAMK